MKLDGEERGEGQDMVYLNQRVISTCDDLVTKTLHCTNRTAVRLYSVSKLSIMADQVQAPIHMTHQDSDGKAGRSNVYSRRDVTNIPILVDCYNSSSRGVKIYKRQTHT